MLGWNGNPKWTLGSEKHEIVKSQSTSTRGVLLMLFRPNKTIHKVRQLKYTKTEDAEINYIYLNTEHFQYRTFPFRLNTTYNISKGYWSNKNMQLVKNFRVKWCITEAWKYKVKKSEICRDILILFVFTYFEISDNVEFSFWGNSPITHFNSYFFRF